MLSGADDVEPGAWPNVAWLDNGCSGVIVAPDLVVFAAHCGTAVTAAWFSDSLQLVIDAAAGTAEPVPQSGASSISITRCETYPNWALANGTDLAFCILSTPAIQQSLIAPPLTGCLHDRLAAGVSVTLVGFGRSTPDGAPGRKRVLEVPITHVGVELSIGDAEYGSCAGDSGSPAFVAVDPTTREDWHLVGVLSTGLAGDGCGVGFYEDLSTVLPWLESASGRDVTPCSTGDGVPTEASCRETALDANGEPMNDVPKTVGYPCLTPPTPHGAGDGCSVAPPGERGGSTAIVLAQLGLLRIRRFRRTRAVRARRGGKPR